MVCFLSGASVLYVTSLFSPCPAVEGSAGEHTGLQLDEQCLTYKRVSASFLWFVSRAARREPWSVRNQKDTICGGN